MSQVISKVLTITIIVALLPIPLLLQSDVQTSLQKLQPIPHYLDIAVALPVNNAGPGVPLVIEPGGCELLVLRAEYANEEFSVGYIWRVDYVDDASKLLNYTVRISRKNGVELELCIPANVEEGLYDLVLVGSRELVVPRSIWIVESLPEKLRVVVMTDLHFGVVGKPDLWRYSAAVIASALNPDLILWAGDIQDVDSEYYAKMAQAYRLMMLYKYPVFSVPGNHDHPGSWYSSYIGPTRWVRVIGNKLLLVGVYTNPHFATNNIITWDEIVFLEEALMNYSYLPYKIIVTHYPMFFCARPCVVESSYDDEETLKPYAPGVETPVSSYWSGNMTAFRYVLKLIEDYNVTAVISGHIHRDQYIFYISTRTGSRTHFVTVTSSGQLTPMYPGVRVFELDTRTGELVFPYYPGVGYFSIPVDYGGLGVDVKLVRGLEAYMFTLRNRLTFMNITVSTVIALPWSPETLAPQVSIREKSHDARAIVKHIYTASKVAYFYLEITTPPLNNLTILVFRDIDTSPPTISIARWIPDVPRLNRTLTLYIDVVDEHYGVDPDSVSVLSNCTMRISTRITPETYYSVFNRVSVEARITVNAPEVVTCRLDVVAVDLANLASTKSYLVIFYPPGVTPQEPPVQEIVEVQETTTTPTSIIMETQTETPITVETPFTPTPEQPATTTAQEQVATEAQPPTLSNGVLIVAIVGASIILAIAIVVVLKIVRKSSVS
ncbi:MAG: metallophosphoesterase [Desulfurococcaceae archaeon]